MKYFQIFKKILPWFSLGSFWIFFDPSFSGFFAENGWRVLLVIMISRPLFQVFPRFTWFRYIVMLRKELGIICASMLLAHWVGYFLGTGTSILTIFTDSKLWNFTSFISWGILGFIVCVPLLLTSNIYSMKLLGKKWKTLQRLSYMLLITWAIHFFMYDPEKRIIIASVMSFWLVLWILANRWVVIWKKQN